MLQYLNLLRRIRQNYDFKFKERQNSIRIRNLIRMLKSVNPYKICIQLINSQISLFQDTFKAEHDFKMV